jgi:inward rectifier potassium channel
MDRKAPFDTESAAVRAASTVRLGGMPNRDDGLVPLNATRRWHNDFYYAALTASWPQFLLLSAGLFLAINAVFAGLYMLQPGGIAGARDGDFGDAFFFSVETLATIGYGQMAPATRYANVLMTAEVLVGGVTLALVTGLAFARFSRPSARVLFSHVAVVGPMNGQPMLTLRIANERRNQVLQAEVRLSLVRDEQTAEGRYLRRFYDLKLARSQTPVFALTFLVMHPVDHDSPLFGATAESLAAENAELVLILTGLDTSVSQMIHARASYLADQVLFGRRFVDVIGALPDGRRAVDYSRFHDTVPT